MNMNKLDEIKFGMLSENELYWLRRRIEQEETNRKKQTDEYVKVIRAEDGSEGFYVKAEDFFKIKSDELHEYIAQTLNHGSTVTFTLEDYEKKDYEENAKPYEWNFGDNNEIIQDEEE